MATMTQEFSQLINNHLYTPREFSDASSSTVVYLEQIKKYIADGNWSKLSSYYSGLSDAVKNEIAKCSINASDINKMDEEILNLEIYAQEGRQSIFYSSTEPTALIKYDVWIG